MLDGAGSSLLTCEVSSDFDIIPTTDPCNPNTSIVPTWTHTLVIKILDKAKNVLLQSTNITLKNTPKDTTIDPVRVTYTREWQSPTYLLSKEDTSLTTYTCDPEQLECKVNLKVVALLDGIESSQITCEITSDFEIIPTTDPCNPNTSIIPIGEHVLTIKILDKAKGITLKTYPLTLKNIPEDSTIDPTRVVTDITWQQPTYLLEKEDTSKSKYTCDSGQSECKINLLVTPKLDGVESSKLACHIVTDFWFDENDCNPATLSVPNWPHTLTLETKNVATWAVISTRTIEIDWLPIPTGTRGSSTKLDLASSQIQIQSGLDESFICRTETCQVNFLAIVPAGASCEWDFGGGVFETTWTQNKCNPGYVKFSSDALVKLTVRDPNDTTNTLTKTLQLSRNKNQKNQLEEENLFARIELQTKITNSKRLTDTGIICALGKAEKCMLNFTGVSSTGAKSWNWDFWDGWTADRENPGGHGFTLGKYQVRLTVSDGIDEHMATYDVEVVKDFEQKEKCQDCEKFRGKIQISAVLPNPPHADTVEWIEVKNISDEPLSLDSCQVTDDDGDFELSGILSWGKTLRLRQAITGLVLWNTHESLEIVCGDIQIDSFAWDFPVPTSYILRREVLFWFPQQTTVTNVVDGDTVDAILDGKKTRIRLLGVDTPETVHPRKPVEKFGKEASDFARRTLEGRTVWITFDADPVDHYGRRLAYIWQCNGPFSEASCTLFNAQVVSEGYGRMERRFQFRRYADFNELEKRAKEAKIGIWSDPEVAKLMNTLSADEKDDLTSEQEKEYLELQEELLKECSEQEIEWCEDKKPAWKEVTERISTLTVSPKKSGIVAFSGRTWWDFSLEIEIYRENKLVKKFSTTSNEIGEYEETWIPQMKGDYVIKSIFRKENDVVEKEKEITIESLSTHFETPLTVEILMQGQITDNRWQVWDVFHCRSREFCSVNVTAQTNRENEVSYLWIFPDGDIIDEKNPWALKLSYGQYEIILIVTDHITEETSATSLHIDHQPIPKKPKKAPSSNYTLDIKDVPPDIGGWGISDTQSPLRWLVWSIVLLLFLASTVYSVFFLKS